MHHWRHDSFEKLAHIDRELSAHPELVGWRHYIQFLERGLRPQALAEIGPQLISLQSLPIERQRALASVMCRLAEPETGHRLLPHPLIHEFIFPTMERWRSDCPNVAEPFRWSRSIDDLAHAVSLEPACDETRRRLILRILGHIGFSTHELPAGYLGDAQDDLALLRLARSEIARFQSESYRRSYGQMVDEEESEILGHLSTCSP